MAEALKRYIARAPRYTLTPEDNKLLYFAENTLQSKKRETELVDVSASGLTFLTDRDYAPALGDMIKIEFTSPGGEKVAWWARAVRIEEYQGYGWWRASADEDHEDLVIVAIQFRDMPEAHRARIQTGIKKRLTKIKALQKAQGLRNFISFLHIHRFQLFLYGSCLVFTLWIFYFLTQPTVKYDGDRGSPWGQRFFQSDKK